MISMERNLISEKRFIFIIGSPRSGTTWLKEIISVHPKVAAIPVELTNFNQYIEPLVTAYLREEKPIIEGRWKQGLPYLWTREKFDTFIQNFLNQIYGEFNTANSSHIIDKHPAYSHCTDIIKYYIPQAKFIHIIRDGRDVVLSMLNANKIKGFGADNLKTAIIHWKNCVLDAKKAKKFGVKSYLEIHYLDLLKNTSEKLKEIFAFCELDCQADFIEQIASEWHFSRTEVSFPNKNIDQNLRTNNLIWQTFMNSKDKQSFAQDAGQLLIDLGFEKNLDWAGKLPPKTPKDFILKKIARRFKNTLKYFFTGKI